MRGKVEAFNPRYLDPIFVTAPPKGIDKVLGAGGREWQLEAFDQFRDSQFSALTAGCGSGKSSEQVALAIQDVILSKYQRLQVIAVPQVLIGKSFFKSNGETSTIQIRDTVYTVSCDAAHNFTDSSSLKRLKALLLSDRRLLGRACTDTFLTGVFALTSYAALARVWDDMTARERKIATHQLCLRLDESHHCVSDESANKVGQMARYMLESGDKTSRLVLSTATNFRGDFRSIVAESERKRFQTYTLDFIKHWQSLGIKEMTMEISEYDSVDPIRQVAKNVCAEKSEKHYIAIPPVHGGWRAGRTDESGGVAALIKAIRKGWADCRILDLTRGPNQKMNKNILVGEPKTAEDGESRVDVTIHQALGREGLDFVPCSRLHVTYVEGSLVMAVQTLGRLLRRFKDKTKVIARYYYPRFPEIKKGASVADLLEDRRNALLLMLQCEELFAPIAFPNMQRDRETGSGDKRSHMGSLEQLLGSQAYRELKHEFLNSAIEQGIMRSDVEDLDALIDSLLDDYDVPEEYHDDAHDTLRVIFLRAANVMFAGVTIAVVREKGFAKMFEKLSAGDRTLVFSHNEKRMRELRAIVQNVWAERTAEVVKRIKVPADWERPENQIYKQYALSLQQQA